MYDTSTEQGVFYSSVNMYAKICRKLEIKYLRIIILKLLRTIYSLHMITRVTIGIIRQVTIIIIIFAPPSHDNASIKS